MKKKSLIFFTLALVLSLCVSLVACNANGNTVNKLSTESGITLDGAFENDSVLKAEHHAADSEQGKAAIAAIDKPYDSAKIAVFDISVSKNGEKVQPGGKVKITMPKPFESDGYVTYHVKGDNTVEELKTTVDGNNIMQHAKGRLCIGLFAVFAAVWAGKPLSTANLPTTTCAKKRATILGAKKTDLPTANVA